MLKLAKIRRDFPITKRFDFLDHANMSPSPLQVVSAVDRLMKDKAAYAYMKWDDWSAELERARSNIASILGASREGVWFANNTSDGINIVANGIQWNKGDNVVIPEIEFPSVVYPFLKRQGLIDIRYAKADFGEDGVRVPFSEFERLVDDRTRVVGLSSVDYGFGTRYDIRKIGRVAHRHGAMLLVDASQSAGAIQMRVDYDGADVVAFGGQKWTFAPSGGGVFYMNPKNYSEFVPPNVGWFSVKDPMQQIVQDYIRRYDLALDARRFATGHLNFPGIVGLAASTQYLLDTGFTEIEERHLYLSGYLHKLLTESGFKTLTPGEKAARAGIMSFQIPNPASVIEALKRKKIIVSGALQTRERGIRVSAAFYNTDVEVERLVENLPQSA
jgi:cysteine desulfurase/selenocysteine lyase